MIRTDYATDLVHTVTRSIFQVMLLGIDSSFEGVCVPSDAAEIYFDQSLVPTRVSRLTKACSVFKDFRSEATA